MPNRTLTMLLLVAPLMACSSQSDDTRDDDQADTDTEEDPGSSAQALTSGVSCTHESQPAYQGGSRIGTVDTIMVDGKRMTQKTANAFLYLKQRAAARGVNIWVNSGFRTMDEQRHLYYCYTSGSCNSGNLAARPGYSNHQNGRAVDIGTDNRGRLNQIISDLGLDWRRTVPSEAWHYEYFGSMVTGPCDGTSGPAPEPPTAPTPGQGTPGQGAPAGGQSCGTDGDCNPGNDGAGLICSGGACIPGCHSNAQCPGVKTCKAGQCK